MKNPYFILFLSLAVTFWSCEDDDDDHHMGDEFEYHIHIHSPSAATYQLGDTMHIDVQFESHTGMPVHHINVQIREMDSGLVLYSKPDVAHVHAESGEYPFEQDLALSPQNGFAENVNYVFEASVWGHDEGQEEVQESVEFVLEP